MPPLIAAVLIGAGAYAGFRAVQRVFSHISADVAAANAPATNAAMREKNLGRLELDPATGVYRPTDPLP